MPRPKPALAEPTPATRRQQIVSILVDALAHMTSPMSVPHDPDDDILPESSRTGLDLSGEKPLSVTVG